MGTPELPIPWVWDDAVRRHVPAAEIWLGVRTPGTELPERADRLFDALAATGAPRVAAVAHDDGPLLAVHSRELVDYLRTAYDEWCAAGYDRIPGQDRVVPYVFPLPGLAASMPARRPAAASARAGRFCYDTMTLIGPGTWEAARAAVDVTLTAADLVGEGAPAAYALVRPPGHHAARDSFGGSCYLNNAAVAAERLRAGGRRRVAIVDIDAHHGNGTQWLFYERADVFYGSVHVDPGTGWFPHFCGFADETGAGPGSGFTRNHPLAPGTGDGGWLAAVHALCDEVAAFRPDAVVVSLGVDASGSDPESPLDVSADGFRRAGAALSRLGPTVFVQEGGYDLAAIGELVVATLTGFATPTA